MLLRKWGSIAIIAALLITMIPVSSGASTGTAAVHVSSEISTQGNWVGVYGSEGYVLPYFTTALTSGRDNPLADDEASLPAYVTSYSKTRSNYWTYGPNDVRALQTPDGSARKKLTVYSGTDMTFTFNVEGSEPFLFSVYSTDFGSLETVQQRYEILDMDNRKLDDRVIDGINNGKYISYQISGSFKLRVTKLSGAHGYAEGFFFDPVISSTVAHLSAQNLPNREALLSWEDSAGAAATILRKRQGEADYTVIASVPSGTTQYTDFGLEPGVVYVYAVQSVLGPHHSLPAYGVELTVPSYEATVLNYLNGSVILDAPGEALELAAELADESGNPLTGKTVSFSLSGEHVGTYIDPTVGTAITDSNGEARLSYAPPFAGNYNIVATFAPDDSAQLRGSTAELPLIVQDVSWEKPPIVFHATDAAKPGTLVSVSGHAISTSDGSRVEVALEAGGDTSQLAPSANAWAPEIVQDDRRGQYLTFRFPEAAAPGLYRLWVKNEFGWSEPYALNAPRPLFISEYEAFDGLSIDVSGRNFMSGEFGASGDAQARPRRGASVYEAELTKLTPYSLRFIVEQVPDGEYTIEISNDGGTTWREPSSGQSLTVVPPGSDPLGLGVAWADSFAWTQVFSATDYGAIADDGEDDTAAITAAVQAAKLEGGGIVQFPAGEFHATRIALPSGVVLMGAGREETLLFHIGGNQSFLYSEDDGKTVGRIGIARLGLRAADPDMLPDAFVWLGHDWGEAVNDRHLRTASEFFIAEFGIEYPVLTPVTTANGSGRGQGILVIGDERFLLKDNRLAGWSAQHTRTYMNRYATVAGNYAEYSYSQMPVSAAFTFIMDNEFVIRGEADVEVHGIGFKANGHVENNVVRTTGAHLKTTYKNDGESIFVEMPSGFFATGGILGATTDHVTLIPVQPIPDNLQERMWPMSVVIIEGTGLGQRRVVQKVEGTTYAVEEEWDVVPDSTSKFTLITSNENVTIYRNQTIDGQRGIWLYGNVHDGVVADNLLRNTDGIYVYSSFVRSSNRFTPSYFVNVKSNKLIGTPGDGHASGIIALSQRNGNSGKYFGTGVYGIEIRDNYLFGSHEPISSPRHQKHSGIVSSAATHSSDKPPIFTDEDRDNLNILIENNRLEQLREGLFLTAGLHGHIASGNTTTSVFDDLYELHGEGSAMLETLPDAYSDNRAPFWPAHSSLEATHSAAREVSLRWPKALDTHSVAGYRIYANGALLHTTDASSISYIAENLSPGAAYTFVVSALDEAGNESLVSLRSGSLNIAGGGGIVYPNEPVNEAGDSTESEPDEHAGPGEDHNEPGGAGHESTANPFSDVGGSHDWALDSIRYLYERGIIQGIGNEQFGPGLQVKRGDALLMLVRALDLDAEAGGNFIDVPIGSYYYDAISIAKALGIAEGDGVSFHPRHSITRQDLMVLIDRALQAAGDRLPEADEDELAPYADQGDIADYARASAARLVKAGIIQGNEQGIYPRGAATRAEIAVVIYRMLTM